MKSAVFFSLLLPALSFAQTAGQITYEHSQQLDPSKMTVRIQTDGPPPPPGAPGLPEMPTNIVRERVATFSGTAAKMTAKPLIMTIERESGPGGTQERELPPPPQMPFEMTTFYDLKNHNKIDFLTVNTTTGKEGYFTKTPFALSPLTITGKTKKIQGYVCKKATATLNEENYVVWITTEVDVTFSPMPELTPEKGLVLAIEGPTQSFRATKIELKPISPAEVLMSGGGKKVTPEELDAKRREAMQNFAPPPPGQR